MSEYDGVFADILFRLNDLSKRVARLETYEAADCCFQPGDIFFNFGTGLQWSHIFDFRLANLPAGYDFTPGFGVHHQVGLGLWADVQGTDDKTATGIRFPIEDLGANSTIQRVGLLFTTLGDDTWDVGVASPILIGAGMVSIADITSVTGNAPSTVGTWELTWNRTLAIVSGAPSLVELCISCFHPPDTNPPSSPSVSNHMVAFAIGGSGDDPWPSSP